MKDIDNELMKDFEDYVARTVAMNYKPGAFSEQRTRWALTKAWNHRYARAGIPGTVREVVGEEKATILFQDLADKIRFNPTLLQMAIDDFRTQEMFRQP